MAGGNIAIEAIMHGVKEFNIATDQIQKNVNKATATGIRKNQSMLKYALKKTLSGSPRSNQRGKSRVYSESIKIEGASKPSSRSGAPGMFSGLMRSGVKSTRARTSPDGNDSVGAVFMKGGRGIYSPNNFKNHIYEAKFPYFAPTVEATIPRMSEAFDKGWAKAISKMEGGL